MIQMLSLARLQIGHPFVASTLCLSISSFPNAKRAGHRSIDDKGGDNIVKMAKTSLRLDCINSRYFGSSGCSSRFIMSSKLQMFTVPE